MVYRSIEISTERALKDVFKQAKIEALVHSFKHEATVEAIIDTTEHDNEVRENERRKVLHEQRALDINMQVSAEELKAAERHKLVEYLVKHSMICDCFGVDLLTIYGLEKAVKMVLDEYEEAQMKGVQNDKTECDS